MRFHREGPTSYTVEFESEAELRGEYAASLSVGGVRLLVADKVPLFTAVDLRLRLAGRGEARARATVVGPLPGGYALAMEGNAAQLLEALLAAPPAPVEAEEEAGGDQQTVWDRMRALTRVEKLLLAGKAGRMERTILAQDNDPQVLYTLLKNPRLNTDEVIRLAKSPYLTYQIAELMMKSTVWFANVEVRVALIHNPKTPPAFAMRILPTLPESEVKLIARGAATSQALKVAALRKLQGG